MSNCKCLPVFLMIVLVVCFISSCEPRSNLSYDVINHTTTPLKLRYQFPGGLLAHTDTIPIGSTKVINQEKRLGNVEEINRRLDSIDFSTLVLGSGDKISHLNLKDKKYWVFKKDNDLEATYTLVVEDRSFTSY